MKVIDIASLIGTDRDVRCPKGGFRSLRPILAKDGMGFSLHITTIHVGDVHRWHYTNHLEACYCISGCGELRNETTSEPYWIQPGVLYVLDKHDPHTFAAFDEVTLVSIFNPPVTGAEVHGEDGSYSIESGE